MALALGCAALAVLPTSATAQPPAGGPFGPGFGPTNRLGDVQKQIGATDEEWKVIGPKLRKVIAARQALASDIRGPDAGSGFPGFGFPGGFGPMPGGPGGFTAPTQPGQILPPSLQGQLKLTPEQKKQLDDLQKEFDGRLDKLLTDDQRKQLAQVRNGSGPGAPPGGATAPAGGFGPFPFGGPTPTGAVGRARADLKAVLDDPKHTKAEVDEKVEAVRKARQKAGADLDAAQNDLEPIRLTPFACK